MVVKMLEISGNVHPVGARTVHTPTQHANCLPTKSHPHCSAPLNVFWVNVRQNTHAWKDETKALCANMIELIIMLKMWSPWT
jgi:hypothetical protein